MKLRFATVWLAGCSGCHVSFLDLDEWLIELAEQVDLVFSPVASDIKTYPEDVDVCLVEGRRRQRRQPGADPSGTRARTRLLVSFGDCAITANVPGMSNMLEGAEPVLRRGYLELADGSGQLPHAPGLVPVDHYLPGCPPSAARIRAFLEPLLRGEPPLMEGAAMIRFG